MLRRVLLLGLLATPALAQEDDRGYLTAFLEDNLSDAGRQVTITGFEGALSSRATIQSLTIADDAGIWLTLNDVTLDWSRSSLLSGALVVSELSAGEILVARVPDTGDSAVPSPEASGFRLPDLPVSVEIGRIAADRIVLDETVLGQPVEGSLEAAATLIDGEGTATLDLLRSNGAEGEIRLDASFSNTSGQLSVDLRAKEAAGGLVVTALNIPDAPAAELELTGSGPLEDFAADLRLATDGEERLAGTITLTGAEDGAYRLWADVAGNLAPLLLPQYVDFFGNQVALKLDATRSALGSLRVDALDLQARSLVLEGQMNLAPDGLVESLDVTGTLASPDGAPVLLPLGEVPTRLDRAEFRLAAESGDRAGWRGEVTLAGLEWSDLRLGNARLAGSGRVARTPAGNSLGGTLNLALRDLVLADPGLAAALGPKLEGALKFHLLEGGDLRLSDLAITGTDYGLAGQLSVAGLDEGLRTSGRITVTAADLSRFSALAGRQIGGSGTIVADGAAGLLSGEIDGRIDVQAQDLQLGIAALDRLLTGQATAGLSLLRDETGTTLRALTLAARSLALDASGTIATEGSDLTGRLEVGDLADLGPGFGGRVSLDVGFRGTPEAGALTAEGEGQSIRIGNDEVDRLLAGASRLGFAGQLRDGRLLIDRASIANPQLDATATAEGDSIPRRLNLTGRLADVGLILSDFSGPVTLTGTATQDGSGTDLSVAVRGPGGIDARVAGRIAAGFGAGDLTITGTGRAGLANVILSPRAVDGAVSYDLRLNGPLRLASLSGRITLSDGRATDPDLGLALEGVQAMAQLEGGRAQVSLTGRPSTGGQVRVDGPVSLTPPFPADLTVALAGVRIYDPELYDAILDGALTISGPLLGGALVAGRLDLREAELRVPSTGFTSAAALLDIRHRNEPAAVRDTRRKAGLLNEGGGAGGTGSERPFRLDLTITAPNQIFLRGRGIDAELGGEIRLTGTSAAVIPSGAFQLVRGRIDILGKRLTLSRADLELEGSFTPLIRISASSENDGIISYVNVDGPADDPVVTFTSTPDLPQEEVLSQLLFGRGLENLSPLQALQLANAVATLAGRGGEGLVNRLRQGFGLDDLDITTADDGSTALRAGKYLSENVYTEVEIGQGGSSRINLNLDLREGVTLKGRIGEDGETGVGIFIERDY
ncbi:translocation/assembly module TamB domain-containing protein [Tabrizicola aquatica]|uniref:translocation/assembly module TamB domain-containing protein n=1 Tax=Tabrizicola aquatica TaxID=909926 RepID=UPI000CD17ADE|nr:translocation/assembly module TamB domain-containing protein [Tabrizicola aquatica]